MTARLYAFAAITAITGLGLLWLALQLPGSAEVTTLVGPRTWPLTALLLMLALVALMVFLLATRGPAQFSPEGEEAVDIGPEDDAVERDEASAPGLRYLGVLAATVAYTVGMSFTGHLVATAVFTALVTVILGERRPLRVAVTTLIAVLVVAVMFDRLLGIPLP